MIESEFEPSRLRLGRELKGWSQAELARSLEVSAQAISQFESGASRPSAATVRLLGKALGVPSAFFSLGVTETHEGFFRSLRRSSVTERRRARAIAHTAHDIAIAGEARMRLPEPAIPEIPLEDLEPDPVVLEGVAASVRRQWQLPAGPISDVVGLLEEHGVVVIRLPLITADVDAFSLPFPDRPVVVLGADKEDRARSRFDAAHELGHLVVHGEHVWGLKEVEQQAHMFAAAFLMPAADIRSELPTRADWPAFFELKRKWQVSIAALLMRAKTLGRMSESDYLTAIKAASARGWRRREPVPLGEPEQPKQIQRLLADPTLSTALPRQILDAIAGAATT